MKFDEVWREIEEFEQYKISSLGRLVHRGHPDRGKAYRLNHQGFPVVALFKVDMGSRQYIRQLNRLVAQAFLPEPSYQRDALWHIDGNLENCAADNLKWEMRARVLEWNDMHRDGVAQFKTPKVENVATGEIYLNAFECAMAVGNLESTIIRHIESYPDHYSHNAKFRYVS